MFCSVCGRHLDFDDDAIEQLIEAGLYRPSVSLFSDHHHLRPHPEWNCPGDSEAIERLKAFGVKVS